jgi:hypothetical protein
MAHAMEATSLALASRKRISGLGACGVHKPDRARWSGFLGLFDP